MPDQSFFRSLLSSGSGAAVSSTKRKAPEPSLSPAPRGSTDGGGGEEVDHEEALRDLIRDEDARLKRVKLSRDGGGVDEDGSDREEEEDGGSDEDESAKAAREKKAKRLEKFRSKTKKGAKAAAPAAKKVQYRDRAAERRKGVNPDYQGDQLTSDAQDLSEEYSKFLGGDVEHTHLVKGLDYALLHKVQRDAVAANAAAGAPQSDAGAPKSASGAVANAAQIIERARKRAAAAAASAAGDAAAAETPPQFNSDMAANIFRQLTASTRAATRAAAGAESGSAHFHRAQYNFELELYAGAAPNAASQVPTTLMLPERDIAHMRDSRTVDRLSETLHRSLASAFAPRRVGGGGRGRGGKKRRRKTRCADGARTADTGVDADAAEVAENMEECGTAKGAEVPSAAAAANGADEDSDDLDMFADDSDVAPTLRPTPAGAALSAPSAPSANSAHSEKPAAPIAALAFRPSQVARSSRWGSKPKRR